MPKPKTIEKAFLQIISWDDTGAVSSEGRKFNVQFNPESLKVAFSNQIAGGDNNGGSAIQFSSRGTTKLSFDLWFDVTAPQPDNRSEDDVRKLTKDVIAFMQAEESTEGEDTSYIPPGCRFQWGSFLFEGVVDSVNENIEYFSETGKPLRASVSVSMTKQEVEIKFANANAQAANQPSAGTQPRQQARTGDSAQSMAAREGNPEGWQQRALSEGIEDPLRLPQGFSLPSSPF